jgi:adenylate kinase family enzyme
MAGELARVFGVPHVEIDALFHGPGWTPRPEFVADVDEFSARDGWVTEWQYSSVRSLLAQRADTLVWLDYHLCLVMRRVILRTIRRRLSGEVLWNGNVEPPLWTIFADEQHIVRWAWNTHAKTAARVQGLLSDGTHLTVVRLRTPAQAAAWLERLRLVIPPEGS